MGISSNTGVSNYSNTTDGRAAGVVALNSGGDDQIGGHGVVVLFGNEAGATSHILTQGSDYIAAQDGRQLITG